MNQLLDWYRANRRELPWRSAPTPYAVWVSEIMLQQTQVATVVDYFNRWMERFPTVESLAAASVDEVLSAWQGLGYYRRARSLHEGARFVAKSGIPRDSAEWRSLPGVGPYTAGAISSIALGLPEPLVDGNVERVYARLNVDRSTGPMLNKNAWRWAEQVLDRTNPGDWNQALMELGATVCTPTNPKCGVCPINTHCQAFQGGAVDQFPTRIKKPAPVRLTHYVWIPLSAGQVGLEQVPMGEWWEGMWSFPRSQTVSDLESRFPCAVRREVGSLRHSVTNHRIELIASVVECGGADFRWLGMAELESVAIPAPHRKALRLAYAAGLISH